MKTAVCVGALALAIATAQAWAQEGGFGKSGQVKEKPGVAKKDKDTGAKRDLVAEAFALPKGAVLRPHQQEPFNKMKQEMEPKLREAYAQVESAAGAEKAKTAKNVLAIRKEIGTKIATILQQPDETAIQAARDALRAARDARPSGRGQGHGRGGRRH